MEIWRWPSSPRCSEGRSDRQSVKLTRNASTLEIARSRPTMAVYSPKGKNTGAAAVVFPGGGYYVLAIDLEGTEVCDWVTAKGMHGDGRRQIKPKAPMALEDAQRRVGLVRPSCCTPRTIPSTISTTRWFTTVR